MKISLLSVLFEMDRIPLKSLKMQRFKSVSSNKGCSFAHTCRNYDIYIYREGFDRLCFLPPMLQLLITLHFFSSSCFQRTDGEIFGLHRTTVCLFSIILILFLQLRKTKFLFRDRYTERIFQT